MDAVCSPILVPSEEIRVGVGIPDDLAGVGGLLGIYRLAGCGRRFRAAQIFDGWLCYLCRCAQHAIRSGVPVEG